MKRGVLILLACCPCAFALDPSLDIHQYAHTSWTIRDGFFNSTIQAVAQTPDGYLWLGTAFGLFRFDGVRKAPWDAPAGERLPSSDIRTLLVTRDGRLWIGTAAGLASWKDGRLIHYPELAGQVIPALLQENGGTVWAGGLGVPTGRLCAIQGGAVQCFGQDGSFGRDVLSLFEENGNLWAGAQNGLWRWKPGPPRRYALPSLRDITDFSKIDGGPLLIAMRGVIQLVGEKTDPYPIGNARHTVDAIRLLADRNGGLWIGTLQQGIFHVHQGKTDLLTRSEGLSGNAIAALFEDREGNVWVGTSEGLDRFRDTAVATISANQGLSSDAVSAVLAARDGSVWLGTPTGLNRWKDGQITVYGKRDGFPDGGVFSLFEDDGGRIWVSTLGGVGRFEDGRFLPLGSATSHPAENIVGDRPGSLWMADVEQGLIHLLGDYVVERIPWPALGHKDFAVTLTSDLTRGGLWLGFRNGGVAFFKAGQIRESYTTAEGLGGGMVTHLYVQADGSVWAATAGGLSRIKSQHVTTLNGRNGLPCETVQWMTADDQHSAWLHMACGLVRVDRAELDAWVADPTRSVKNTVFDSSDGVRNEADALGYNPRVAKSTDGRLWFGTFFGGVSVIDPRDLHVNRLPPPVHIEDIIADRKLRWQNLWGAAASNLRLPALSRDLEIDYTALSLVAPEKIRFKYKLEGYDRDWQAGNRRQAFYTNLSPQNYRFRVMACNNSGVWNEAGDTLEFSIAPAYYQTTWFRLSCVAAFFALLWALYRYRLYQIKQEFNARLEERVGERTRIARELHDTLLQSFQGALLEFQAARNLFSRRPEEAIRTLDGAISSAEGAIVEGRDAIQDLRPGSTGQTDLEHLLTTTGQELASAQDSNGNRPVFRVTVEGPPQTLSPVLQDEVYRIGREVLRNAFRHAHASRIEAEIRYDDRLLRVRIRDDGKGIDKKIQEEGTREGHWGLPGIRERAKRIGARLTIWSEIGAGTEVELSIPASIAYESRARRRIRLFKRRLGTNA